jgi:hypothetical protein
MFAELPDRITIITGQAFFVKSKNVCSLKMTVWTDYTYCRVKRNSARSFMQIKELQ